MGVNNKSPLAVGIIVFVVILGAGAALLLTCGGAAYFFMPANKVVGQPPQKTPVVGSEKRQKSVADVILFKHERIKWENNTGFVDGVTVNFTVENKSKFAIKSFEFRAIVRSPGRKVPWVETTDAYDVAGGIEAGESVEIELYNQTLGWLDTPKDVNGLIVEIIATGATKADGEPLVLQH